MAQNKTTLPTQDLSSQGAVQALQQNLDQKFSIVGGTVTGTVNLSSGNVFIANLGKGLIFPDATKQTTAYRAQNSSFTTGGFGGTWTNTTYGACDSSVTITTTGNPIAVVFSGSLVNNTNATATGVNFLQDGAFVSPWTSSAGPAEAVAPCANCYESGGFYFVVPAPSSASHTYCITRDVSAGTGSYRNSAGQFGVWEIK